MPPRERTPFGQRLFEARTRAKLTQPQLAKRVGMGQSTLAEAEYTANGSSFTAQLAKATGVRSEWLAAGVGERDEPEQEIDPEEFAFVRRADVSFANGIGKVAYHEDDKPPLVFRREFLRKLGIAEGDAVVVDGAGHSNVPKIPEGAVVLVNCGDRLRLNGEFFAFRAGGELLIKRLEELKGVGILATADNPDFKPKTVIYRSEADQIEVIGRAVWVGATI